ncbi:hypothetical protein BaRGS_00039576 [Batillaria attramentaria]|uniref:Uncharacterized protein n=1 Tax=Batillaria attramentaria TaxID=370345 RepID=A0ABD0J3D9_9CAEN
MLMFRRGDWGKGIATLVDPPKEQLVTLHWPCVVDDLMGSVMTEKRHYEVHALPEGSTANRRSTDPLRVLVTWTDVDLRGVKNNLGLTTTDELIDLQVMKWSGAQAILGDVDSVTWNIKIKLFKIENLEN